jgi:general secretion pathway protein F
MAEFDWRAIDPAGRERSGRLSAPSADAARLRLEARRLFPVAVEPAGRAAQAARAGAGAAPGASGTRLSAKLLTLFTRQLATLSRVSPLEEALNTIAAQSERAATRDVIGSVAQGVVEGRPLSEAMAREPRSFPALYRAMVSAGEQAGALPEILDRLAALLERQAQVRGKVIGALAYPAVLAVLATAIVIALLAFVVPRVVEQFDDVGQRLPLLTRIVIALSEFLSQWWWALGLALAAGVALGVRLLADPARRLAFDRWLLGLPVIGRVLRDLAGARIARTLSTMVESRLPLVDGLLLTQRTVGNRAIAAALGEAAASIREGGGLAAALRRSGLFPPILVVMTASGEASGRLGFMLGSAADYLEREFDGFTQTTLALLEPMIVVIMGGLVAVIVLSILLPILQLQALATR